jgi:hypothetical protein
LPSMFNIHSTENNSNIEWFTQCMATGTRVDGPETAIVNPGLYGIVIKMTVDRNSALGQQIGVFGYNRERIFVPHYKTKKSQVVVMGPVVEGTVFMPPQVNEQWLMDGVEEVILSMQQANSNEMELALFMKVPLKAGQQWVCEKFQILPPISMDLKRGEEVKR